MHTSTTRGASVSTAVGAIVDPVAPRVQADRLVVPDVLRGVAILAMLIAHAGRLVAPLPGPVHFLQGNISDVASPLFALVMGMSAAIVVMKTRVKTHDRGLLVLQNAIRGALLVVLGLWLDTWGTWIAIVLGPLGVTLIIGTPIVLLSTRWVLAIAGGIVVVSQPVHAIMSGLLPALYNTPWAFPMEWLFTAGEYRALNLLPFFLVGVALLRHGFRRDSVLLALLVVALLAYPLRPLYENLVAPALGADAATMYEMTGSGTYIDTLHDVGLVFLTYVVIVALATVRAPGAARVVDALFTPLRALGTVSLSVYVLQVAVVAVMARFAIPIEGRWAAWLILVVGVSLVGILWWRFVGKGPIEWMLGIVSGRYRLSRRLPEQRQG
jgi:uncharacterized protein